MKKVNETNKGITMVALVVTIIVLLILAAIAISLSIENNGLFARTKEGKKKYTIEDYGETLELLRANPEIDRANINLSSKEYMDIYESYAKTEVRLREAEVLRKEDNKVRVITEEGYVFDITEDKINYIGIYGKNPPPDITQSDIDFILNPSGWTNGDVSIKVDSKVEGYNLQYSKNGDNWEEYKEEIVAEENGNIYVRLSNELDEAGEAAVIVITNIDKQEPVVAHTVSNKAEIVTIVINATDTSGIKSIKNITVNDINKVNETTYTVSKNGTYIFDIKYNAGNTKNYSVNINNIANSMEIEVFDYMRKNSMTPQQLGFTAQWSNAQYSEFSNNSFFICHTSGATNFSAYFSLSMESIKKLGFFSINSVDGGFNLGSNRTTDVHGKLYINYKNGESDFNQCNLERSGGDGFFLPYEISVIARKNVEIDSIGIQLFGYDPDYGGSDVRLTKLTITGLK